MANLILFIMTTQLTGTWHLQQSTFPMWHKEGVSDVTFNYTPEQRKEKPVLKDEVKYTKNGKKKEIVGYDTADGENSYTWQGKGILAIAKSKWKVEWMSTSGNCMVISFEKTIATPAGVDILTRGKASEAELKEAQSIVITKQLLKEVKDPLLPVL